MRDCFLSPHKQEPLAMKSIAPVLLLASLLPLAAQAGEIGPSSTPRFPGREAIKNEKLTLPEQKLSPDNSWYNELELGYLTTSGNSDTEVLNAKAKTLYENGSWRNRLELTALNAATDDKRTDERYNALGKSDFKITEKDYSFLRAEYEQDRFSGFDYQGSGAFGLGRRFIDADNMLFELEAGPGYREAKESESHERRNDTILYAGERFSWQFTENAQLVQQLTSESGSENRITEALVALKLGINEHFAMKLSWRGEHTSEVPEGVKKLDSETGVNLVYGF